MLELPVRNQPSKITRLQSTEPLIFAFSFALIANNSYGNDRFYKCLACLVLTIIEVRSSYRAALTVQHHMDPLLNPNLPASDPVLIRLIESLVIVVVASILIAENYNKMPVLALFLFCRMGMKLAERIQHPNKIVILKDCPPDIRLSASELRDRGIMDVITHEEPPCREGDVIVLVPANSLVRDFYQPMLWESFQNLYLLNSKDCRKSEFKNLDRQVISVKEAIAMTAPAFYQRFKPSRLALKELLPKDEPAPPRSSRTAAFFKGFANYVKTVGVALTDSHDNWAPRREF